MKVSYQSDYALKALHYLGRQTPGKTVVLADIAAGCDIPYKFLEQIMITLRKSGYVRSKRGKHGGYYLRKPAERITVGEIIRLIEGGIGPIDCVEIPGYDGCAAIKRCSFRKLWQRVNRSISQVVDNTTLADIT